MRIVTDDPIGASSCEALRRRAAGDEHGAVPGDRRAADARELDDRSRQVGVRRRRRERLKDDLGHTGLSRCGGAVAGGEERDAVLLRRLVHVGERAPLAEAAPGSEELDPPDVERSFGREPDARPVAGRRAVDNAVAHQDAARTAGVGSVEVAVDTDHRGGRREPLLHRRDLLQAQDRLVGEHRTKGVETGGPRADDDVHRDRPVRGELNRPVVGDAGHQRRRLSRSGCGNDQSEKPSDEECAHHDPE